LVDNPTQLDGYHEKFIDLMHLTQDGRQEVAEAFFRRNKETLRDASPLPQSGSPPLISELNSAQF